MKQSLVINLYKTCITHKSTVKIIVNTDIYISVYIHIYIYIYIYIYVVCFQISRITNCDCIFHIHHPREHGNTGTLYSCSPYTGIYGILLTKHFNWRIVSPDECAYSFRNFFVIYAFNFQERKNASKWENSF